MNRGIYNMDIQAPRLTIVAAATAGGCGAQRLIENMGYLQYLTY